MVFITLLTMFQVPKRVDTKIKTLRPTLDLRKGPLCIRSDRETEKERERVREKEREKERERVRRSKRERDRDSERENERESE